MTHQPVFRCYQWLIQDNQETCYPSFIITDKHYLSREDVEQDWSPRVTEGRFNAVRPIRESKLVGELGRRVYEAEWTRREG